MGGGDNRHSGDCQGQWTESGKVPDAYLHGAAGSVCERLQMSSTFLHDMINMREKKRKRLQFLRDEIRTVSTESENLTILYAQQR